jgi:hypothetical protein
MTLFSLKALRLGSLHHLPDDCPGPPELSLLHQHSYHPGEKAKAKARTLPSFGFHIFSAAPDGASGTSALQSSIGAFLIDLLKFSFILTLAQKMRKSTSM